MTLKEKVLDSIMKVEFIYFSIDIKVYDQEVHSIEDFFKNYGNSFNRAVHFLNVDRKFIVRKCTVRKNGRTEFLGYHFKSFCRGNGGKEPSPNICKVLDLRDFK